MKIRKILSLAIIISVAMTSLAFADGKGLLGEENESDPKIKELKKNLSEKPEESYLAKFHSIDIVNKLLKKNLDQIYLLKVIVSNFHGETAAAKGEGKEWEKDYVQVYQEYKNAMERYYKRDIIYSRVQFEENQENIQNFLKKIGKEFARDAETMLGVCAKKIMLLHLDAETRSNPDKNKELHNNQMRLRIAYGQFDDANLAYIDHNYEAAIYHLRVSKTYAIKILEDIVATKAINDEKDDAKKRKMIADEQKKIKEKYKLHKADNLNRIHESKLDKIRGAKDSAVK